MASKNILGKIPLWLKIIIGIVIALILIFLFLWIKYLTQPSLEKTNLNKETAGYQKVLSRTGTIKEINSGKIIFMAPSVLNPDLKEDTVMTALLSGETKYYGLKRPKISPKEMKKGESRSVFQRTAIGISDLKKGDNITVVSAENIWGKTEFPAKKVELIK